MSELVSRYPTAGGIYWWAARLGGPVWGWFTGWFNIIGLVAVVASVDYGAATFLNALLGLFKFDFLINFADSNHVLAETFVLFVLILAIHAVMNIFNTHLLAQINNVSVWWHVVGVAVIIGLLVFVPDHHQNADFVFTQRFNNSGFGGHMYWFYVLPLGFLLTQYTITGFDASAHISEETHGASEAAAKGVWRSIFYSAVIGWFLLLAVTFAASNVKAVDDGGGHGHRHLRERADQLGGQGGHLHRHRGPAVLRRGVPDQRVAHVLRLLARPRPARLEGPLEGQRARAPRNAVLTMAAFALIITLPALKGTGAPCPTRSSPWCRSR